jgi:glycosyltransferase involved in cell wall biosynthesis
VSSYVVSQLGGVEQYNEWLRLRLVARGFECRVVSCDHRNAIADAKLPYKPLGPRAWPFVAPSPSVIKVLRREVAWADIVFIQYHAYPLSLWAALAAFQKRKPAWTFIHMVAPPSFRSKLYKSIAWAYDQIAARLTLRCAHPIAVSAVAADFIESRFRILPVRAPFPMRPLPERPHVPPPNPGEPLHVVSAGRLSDVKRPLDVITACDLVKSGPVQLHIYGTGPLEQEVQAMAATRPWIAVHGAVPWEQAVAAQGRAHAVISASVMDTTQAALLEPMAMGVPAVATKTGDAFRYFEPPLERFLTPQDQPQALADGLDLLRSDYSAWQDKFAIRGVELREMFGEDAAERAVLAAAGLMKTNFQGRSEE